jgi:hypothetical protein
MAKLGPAHAGSLVDVVETTSSWSSESHLVRLFREFAAYYNRDRPHRSLDLYPPRPRSLGSTGPIVSRPILGSLHHRLLESRVNSCRVLPSRRRTAVFNDSLASSGRYRARAEDRLPWATSSQTMECRRAKLDPAGSATRPGRSNRSASSSPHSQASSGSDTSATCARSWPSSSITTTTIAVTSSLSLQAPVPKPQASHGGNAVRPVPGGLHHVYESAP